MLTGGGHQGFLIGMLLSILLASWTIVAVAGSEPGVASRYAAAWERYLAAGTPEDVEDLGATWERFWATQAVEPVGAYLVRDEAGGADVVPNRYAAASQKPQSVAPGNYGATWALFWANVEAGGIVEMEDGFEVVCCR